MIDPHGASNQATDPARAWRFNLGDGIVSIGAIAACLGLARVFVPWIRLGFRGLPFESISGVSGWWTYVLNHPKVAGGFALYASVVSIAFLMIWSIAYVMMCMRRPGPGFVESVSESGMVAIGALFAAFAFAFVLGNLWAPGLLLWVVLSAAIPTAWATLVLTGCWESRPDWIHRFGRMIGFLWCLMIPLYSLLILIQ
ncbi:hypothetical protein EP7_001237 [Isosphaeraceae bacterium EP7]